MVRWVLQEPESDSYINGGWTSGSLEIQEGDLRILTSDSQKLFRFPNYLYAFTIWFHSKIYIYISGSFVPFF